MGRDVVDVDGVAVEGVVVVVVVELWSWGLWGLWVECERGAKRGRFLAVVVGTLAFDFCGLWRRPGERRRSGSGVGFEVEVEVPTAATCRRRRFGEEGEKSVLLSLSSFCAPALNSSRG